MADIVFASAFGGRISAFLDDRVARGYKRETWIAPFIKFDRWLLEVHPEETELTQDLAHEWIDDETASAAELARRVSALRMFGKYLCATGESAYVPPEKYAPVKSTATPHIFSDSELTALFSEIDALPPTEKEPFLHEMAPTLFRLIYTCGLRPNEGRELLTENVHLDSGRILLTHTKRNKERMVIMSDDMLAMARDYELRRRILANGNPYFFPSAGGGAMTSGTVYAAFNRAWSRVGLPDKYPGRVRVYDLRHRFASARLNLWLDGGENLEAMLPFLREYMGHRDLSETAYYIHILPENLMKSSAIDWDKFESMFPEVKP